MTDQYARIVGENLSRLYARPGSLKTLAACLPAGQSGDTFSFQAFGRPCTLSPEGIVLGREPAPSVMGILISLYALSVTSEVPVFTPYRAFREVPDSMPYVGAFAARTEQALIPHVSGIKKDRKALVRIFGGENIPVMAAGDFAFSLLPLPKVALCYIVYEADDAFPASVTCLVSANAHRFLPVDALADVGEYTSRCVINRIMAADQ